MRAQPGQSQKADTLISPMMRSWALRSWASPKYRESQSIALLSSPSSDGEMRSVAGTFLGSRIDIPVVTAWHRRTQKSLWMYVWVHEEYKEKRKKGKVIFLGSQQLVPVSVNKNATHILRPSNMPLCWPWDYPLWGSLYYSCFYVFMKCLFNETICVL